MENRRSFMKTVGIGIAGIAGAIAIPTLGETLAISGKNKQPWLPSTNSQVDPLNTCQPPGCGSGGHNGWQYVNVPQSNNTAWQHASALNAIHTRTLTQAQWSSLITTLIAWLANIRYAGADELLRLASINSGICDYPYVWSPPADPTNQPGVGRLLDNGDFSEITGELSNWFSGGGGVGVLDVSNYVDVGLSYNGNDQSGFDFVTDTYMLTDGGLAEMTDAITAQLNAMNVSDGVPTIAVDPATYGQLQSEANYLLAAAAALSWSCSPIFFPPTDVACAVSITAGIVGLGLTTLLQLGLISKRQ